jgi:hypothetical protein
MPDTLAAVRGHTGERVLDDLEFAGLHSHVVHPHRGDDDPDDGEQTVSYAKAHCANGSNNGHTPYKNGDDESGSKAGKGSNMAFSAFHRQHIQQNDQRNSRDACRYDFTDNRCINLCPRHTFLQ